MPEYGISVGPDGTIKVGDLDNPKFMVTPTQWAAITHNKTLAEVQAAASALAAQYDMFIRIDQLNPLKVTLSTKDFD